MAFTKALYYPWIDIRDDAWLKNAILYWDTIHTIVPQSLKSPYTSDAATACADEQILIPLHVDSGMEIIKDLADDVLRYLSSTEAAEFLLSAGDSSHDVYLHPEKLPDTLLHLARLHPEKLSDEVRHIVQVIGLAQAENDKRLRVDTHFADFYMTLLATRLSESRGIGLLTSTPSAGRLATTFRVDGSLHSLIPEYEDRIGFRFHHGRSMKREMPSTLAQGRSMMRGMPSTLAQGILSHFAFKSLNIDPETPISRIIKFRRKRADQLRRFRVEIESLTKDISFDMPVDAIRQQVSDTHENKVLPAFNELKACLTDERIKWLTTNYLKVAFFSSTPPGALALMGLSSPYAILAGVGISLVASGVLYNREKNHILRDNPYSYLLAIEKEF
ncbi:MAG: hypothetical protein HYV27_09570 [Candidatus Hydrogenedentes bacterium]|nr:hypothetical protein [Candidatus Hydrogenedentota bacterium]